jgi:type IV pilus assembly protein PilM
MAAPHVMGVWGIDLGQCALKAIRLENTDGTVTATAFDYIEHPKILSQPDADPDELTREALQQFLSRNSIKGDMVVISVPGQSGLARFVKLPPVEEKKIADIVKFEAKQQIPFPLEEVVWDFQKIGQGLVTDGFAMETEIGLFAMKKDMVQRAIQQFKDVKVEIHVIQMAPLALCNYVAYDLLHKDGIGGGEGESEGADSKECIVALDIGTDSSNLIITDGEKIIWQRPIPLGGNHFTRALTKDMKLTFAKAEHLKRNAVKSPDLRKILASLKTVLNDFVGEVQRSLGYFTNTHRDATIKYMIGLGNAFRLPGLQKYLQEKLQLEVRKLNKLERVTGEEVTAAPTFTENLLSFAVAYGLSLQGLKQSRIQTNLLPYEIRVERIVRGKKPWAVAAAAALLLAVAGLTFGYSVEKRGVDNPETKDQMAKAEATAKKISANSKKYDDWETAKKNAIAAVRKLNGGVEERFNWQNLIEYINMALPRPNGERLVDVTMVTGDRGEQVRSEYLTENAKKAFRMLEEKRFSKGFALKAEDEEFIKKHLIQINVEGINALYTEDLIYFFKNIITLGNRLTAMKPEERELLAKVEEPQTKDKLPSKGWVVEIRGYTYNYKGEKFVENTFVENLANPSAVWGSIPDKLKKTFTDFKSQVSYLAIKSDVVKEYNVGEFKYIHSSYLKWLINNNNFGEQPPPVRGALGEGQKPDRNRWRAIGGRASTLFTSTSQPQANIFTPLVTAQPPGKDAPPPVPQQARTEFYVFFVWQEPLPVIPAPGAPVPADIKK